MLTVEFFDFVDSANPYRRRQRLRAVRGRPLINPQLCVGIMLDVRISELTTRQNRHARHHRRSTGFTELAPSISYRYPCRRCEIAGHDNHWHDADHTHHTDWLLTRRGRAVGAIAVACLGLAKVIPRGRLPHYRGSAVAIFGLTSCPCLSNDPGVVSPNLVASMDR